MRNVHSSNMYSCIGKLNIAERSFVSRTYPSSTSQVLTAEQPVHLAPYYTTGHRCGLLVASHQAHQICPTPPTGSHTRQQISAHLSHATAPHIEHNPNVRGDKYVCFVLPGGEPSLSYRVIDMTLPLVEIFRHKMPTDQCLLYFKPSGRKSCAHGSDDASGEGR